MQEQQLYEYAIIRIVPRVEREEFINAGIILFCKKTGFIDCRISLNKDKLYCLAPDIDLQFIIQNLSAFEAIALGKKQIKSAIATLDAASRFRWLTAVRSTVIQCSRVHPGMANEPGEVLDKLFQQLVT